MPSLVENNKAISSKIIAGESAVLSEDRMKILKTLSKESKYPAQIARELNMQVQTVYYHISALAAAGFIELAGLVEKNGATAKKYALTADSFSFVACEKWAPFSNTAKIAPKLFAPFVKSGFFDGKIIVGSPDPHGKYRGNGSEFCAMELAMHLGSFSTFQFPLYFLDTETRADTKKDNLILIGGPKVNTVVSEINPNLPIKFDEQSFNVVSKLSGKTYGENVGIIELIKNPFNPASTILFIAGSNHFGTRVAIMALASKTAQIEKGNAFEKKQIAKVVQGFDEDGDGIVDAFDFLE